MANQSRIPIADACLRLRQTYHQVRALLFKGEVKGGKDEFGRFYVDRAALERLEKQRTGKRGNRGS